MKKSLLLIKALIIVVWSAQVSLAQQEATSLTSDIFGYFLVFLWLLPWILQELLIMTWASVLSILITSPLTLILFWYDDEKLNFIQRTLWYLCYWPIMFMVFIFFCYFTYKINVWWFDLYWFESLVKLCWRTGNCSYFQSD